MTFSSKPQNPARILGVSFNFPPLSSPRAIQVARLLRHLPASTVVVCADEEGGRQDPTLEPNVELFLEACLRVPFTVKKWQRLLSRVTAKFRLPVWNKIPDQYRLWKKPALGAINNYLRHQLPPDVLVTFGQPMSDHLIGAAVHKRHRIPWVAHFSDPWVDNPFHRYDWLTRVWNSRLEEIVVKLAGRLIFTSQETMHTVMSKYPPALKTKARVLPHAFDPQWYPYRVRAGGRKLSVRYLGELYGQRSPKPLFDALHRILSSKPAALENIEIELIGPVDERTLRNSGVERLPKGLVTMGLPVSYQESLALMVSADGLLVIDAPAEKSVFLPSKLIDYMGAGRPILGITPPGTSATLIQQLGGWVANPNDVEAISKSLLGFFYFLQENINDDLPAWGTPSIRNRYEAPVVASAFRLILEEMI